VVLLAVLLLVLALISIVRALRDGAAEPPATSGDPSTATSDAGGAAAEKKSALSSPTPESEGQEDGATADEQEIVRSGTVGDGTWMVADPVAGPVAAPSDPGSTVHRYAVRVEGGTGIEADEAAAAIAEVLADPRGWQDLEEVTFQQVATLEEAEFTISLASPPTVDELCLPARTGGLWSCRIGPDVALNSDRWLHATPTYEELGPYRAYMINHEVGHFLGHGHEKCGADGEPAPVMLQQSIDLQGCVPNAWPAEEPGR